MKSIYNKMVRIGVFLLPFYLFTFMPLEASAKKQKQLVILHTNDTHSQILPVNIPFADTACQYPIARYHEGW